MAVKHFLDTRGVAYRSVNVLEDKDAFAELTALGEQVPAERLDMELLAAPLPLDSRIKSRASLDEAIFEYRRSAQLADDAIREYERRTHAIRSVSIVFPQYLEKARAEHQPDA